MQEKNTMKISTIIYSLTLGGTLLFASQLKAQERTQMSKTEDERIDSLQTVYRSDQKKTQETKDQENLSTLKDERADTRSKAKEAQRVERDANNAAYESKNAYKAERKAQKSRRKADAQAKKAARARDKSNNN
jgi:hypothetical protein